MHNNWHMDGIQYMFGKKSELKTNVPNMKYYEFRYLCLTWDCEQMKSMCILGQN